MFSRGSYEWALFQTLDPIPWSLGWEENFGDFHRKIYPPTLADTNEAFISTFVFENPPTQLLLASLLSSSEVYPIPGCSIARPSYADYWWECDCTCKYSSLSLVLGLRLVCRQWNRYILNYISRYLDMIFSRTDTYLPLYLSVSTRKHRFRYYRILENLWRLSGQ